MQDIIALIKDNFIIVEELLDGPKVIISYKNEEINYNYGLLQNKNDQFNSLKIWCNTYKFQLKTILCEKYEFHLNWLNIKNSLFYDKLNSYFIVYDIFDLNKKKFLSTLDRNNIIKNTGLNISYPNQLFEGIISNKIQLLNLINLSSNISSDYFSNMQKKVTETKNDFSQICCNTNLSRTMKGLFIRLNDKRIEYIREDFENYGKLDYVTNCLKNE